MVMDNSSTDNSSVLSGEHQNQLTFTYSQPATIEINNNVFGLSTIKIWVEGTPICGLGTIDKAYVSISSGTIFYNNLEDLTSHRYEITGLRNADRLQLDLTHTDNTQPLCIFFAEAKGPDVSFSGIIKFN
ncbi:hypothetical protein NADFUDRAFT_48646 [Nadsonia fulvescens var. elongata DSM 6958]|uniref:Uncharacterized protein n=1 Tax=Nadsonia fulvescens var. elongata DSM 6958 TaxID=857566 RepID=A0A1E3PRE4_9ASCO|nr:hypothetical protein NADFUDRAFT_48646 [Nadsonia fulvescens var. elongata DSM 6958]